MREPRAAWGDDRLGGTDAPILTWLRHLVSLIAALAFIVTLLATLGGLMGRYFGLRGFEWTFELAAIGFLWTSFFGVLVAEIRRENVALTLLADRLTGPAGAALALACSLVVLPLAVVLLDSGIAFMERSGMSPTPLMRLPRVIQILPFICFAAGLLLILSVRFVDTLRRARAR